MARLPFQRIAAGLVCTQLLALPSIAAPATAPRTEELADLTVEELLAMNVAVVTSASKHEEHVSRAPASVTVVTADEIRDLGHRTIADVLNGVRGFFTTDDRNYARVAIRGLGRPGDYNTRVLLLLDGHQLNDSLYDTAFVGNDFPVDLELVDRVEIVRGPAAALYGGNAMFAVVNVVTRSPAEGRRSSAAVGGGSFAAKRARLEYAGGIAIASLSAHDTAGPTLTYGEFAAAPGGGVARGLDWERGGRAFVKASRGGLRLVAGVGVRQKGIPTGAFGVVFGDDRSRTTDLRAFAEVAFEGAVASSLHASVRAYADEYRYDGRYPIDDGAGFAPVYVDDHVGRWIGTEGRLRWTLGRHALTLGAEGRQHLRQAMRSGSAGEPLELEVVRTPASGAAYGQAEVNPADWLKLTAGARWDAYTDFGVRASPRVAVIVEPRSGTTLKVLRGEAYRPPNMYEQLYWTLDPYQPFELRPEVIRTTELVVEQSAWRGARLSASAYRWDLYGIMSESADVAGNRTFVNADRISSRGLELEVEQRLASGGTARASWAYQRSQDVSEHELTNSPRHLGKLQLAAPVGWDPLRCGVELVYVSGRRTLADDTTGGHVLANVSAALRGVGGGRFDLRATVRNALDRRYSDPGSTEHLQDALRRDGRTLDLELVARF